MATSLADGLLLGDDSDDVECADAATRESLWRPPTQPPLRLGFPDGWPDSFRSCPPLKRLLGGSHLRGSRCRAVEPPSAAELTAAAAAGVVPLPLRSFANATRLAVDNQGAIELAYNPQHHDRTKHIERRHFFIRELVENGELVVNYVNTVDNIADFFTKCLSPSRFVAMRDLIMNIPPAASASCLLKTVALDKG